MAEVLAPCELFHEIKLIVDAFLEEQTPGVFVNIELQHTINNQYGQDAEVRAEVKLYNITPSGHDIFESMPFRMKNKTDLAIFCNYLKIIVLQWGPQLSSSDSE